ncbi:MAG: type IX secretion system sortase PorU, partial [Cyclobacteriaceae bacterium]|nr:type IX secretion system sortase PorU [Cyclobacteriaceae bacterium HetDA_MAG_MS6]
ILTSLSSRGQSSVLATGEWHKVGITESGVYKIDQEFLSGSLGLNLSNLDPRTIKVYGNGGKILPQSNSEARAFDLQENACLRIGLDDGSFDGGDYILFYAIGPNPITFTSLGPSFEKNIYSDTAYYFITFEGDPAKSPESINSIPGTFPEITSFDDYIVLEEDETNLLGSGRNWLGDRFSRTGDRSRNYNFDLSGLDGGDVEVFLSGMAQSEEDCSMQVSLDGQPIGTLDFGSIPTGPNTIYSIKGRVNSATMMSTTVASDNSEVLLNFVPGNNLSIVFLDQLALRFKRSLALYSDQTAFRSLEALNQPVSTYIIAGEGFQVWDISDPYNMALQQVTASEGTTRFSANSDTLRSYLLVKGSDFPTPINFGEISNQNIKGKATPDGIIVSHPEFLSEAKRLAAFHETEGLSVEVFSTWQVYNEFSSGAQDITAIRDMAKYFRDQSANLKYLLLFGDGSYDYKDRISGNTNFVPIYESRNSVHPIESHSSDDYFGFLDDDEGDWIESESGDHTMEIGVGRIPAKTQEEAEDVVNKIIRYATSLRTQGKWKNRVSYVADDGDNNLHVRHAEQLSSILEEDFSQSIMNKIYIDAFEQEITPNEQLSPEGTSALKRAIDEGTFVINYIGHGDPQDWSEEAVLTREVVADMTNRFKLPIFVTATCEFGKYDNPREVSGAEKLLLNPNGGGIALLTTTRPVFASSNLLVNIAFHEHLFALQDGKHPRLGDVIRATKNNSLRGYRNRNFSLLGDPMLQLAYPDHRIQLDAINNQPLETVGDTLSALEEITIEGHIDFLRGGVVSDFNGSINMTLFDAKTDKRTKGQESVPYTYRDQTNALFRGEATVEEGRFSMSFIMPKNISYRFEEGKMNFYAWDETRHQDANGSFLNILIGGTDNNIVEDDTPPDVKLYLNDSTFQNGDQVGLSSLLIAELSDLSGINISTSGINQNITLNLNNQEPILLNDFYTAAVDDFTKGFVVFPIKDLAPGEYEATFKVWDTHNNSTEKSVEFVVSDQPRVRLFNVRNYPNPVVKGTTFVFEHDRLGEELDVTIQIFNMQGAQMKALRFNLDDSPKLIDELRWEHASQEMEQGIYLYRLTVQSTLDDALGQEFGRLIINN